MTQHVAMAWAPGSNGKEAGEPAKAAGVLNDGGPTCDGSAPSSQPWAVVLAGGEGTRLQSFLRQALGHARPKQFCRIIGSRSMLRHTWDRALRVVASDRIVTAITAGQEPYLDEEAVHGMPDHVLVQPANRDNAPGLLLALLWIARRSPGATVLVFPADHFVGDEERFAGHVRATLSAAQYWPDRLALLGVEADGPDGSYGWIAPGQPLAGDPQAELYAVRRFWEKPDPRTAAHLFACGHFWNTLVMAGRVTAYLSLAAAWVPEVLGPLRTVAPSLGTPAAPAALAAVYDRIPRTNLSRALLARCRGNLMVLAARGVCWSDWGEPDRILRTLRRIDRRPNWLPACAPNQAQATSPS